MGFPDWVLERPAGLLLLALPLALALWLRRRREPHRADTSQLDLWARLAAEDPRSAAGVARGLPPRARLLLAALALLALAVAGPGPPTTGPPREVRLLVDRSPSMHLEHPAGGTRLDRALALTLEALEGAGIPDEERLWSSAGLAPHRGASPPAEWRVAPEGPLEEVSPSAMAGQVLVTDRWREGFEDQVACGGAAVPGPVGEDGGLLVVWDGEALLPGPAAGPRTVGVDPAIPPRLRLLVELWGEERGHRVLSLASEGDLRLRLVEGPAAEVDLELPGYGLRGRLRPLGSGGEPWPSPRTPLARAGAVGELLLGLESIEELRGDPAAFAVAWGELLDRSLPPREGVVALEERLQAGPERIGRVRALPSPGGPDPERISPSAWLSLAALLLSLTSLLPRNGSRLDRSRKPQ